MDASLVSQALDALKGRDCTELVLVCDPPVDYNMAYKDVKIAGVPMTIVASVYHMARAYSMAEYSSVLTGVGVGGAVALVLAVIIFLETGEAVPVCTFGAPAVGCTMFARVAAKLDHARFLHRADVVPSEGLFFRHMCKPIYVGEGQVSCITRVMSRLMRELGCGVDTGVPKCVYLEEVGSLVQNASDLFV